MKTSNKNEQIRRKETHMILHCPIDELVAIIKSHIPNAENVQTIMLHGSRADGRAYEYSDYDLVIIQDPCVKKRMSFVHDNIPFSCRFFSPEATTAKNMTSEIAFFCFRLKPLYDPMGIGRELAKAVDNHVKKASKTTSDRQEQIEKYFAYLMQTAKDIDSKAKQVKKESLSKSLELEEKANKARIDCLLLSLDYMFLYHGMPDVGGKKELEVLLRDDPKLFNLFVQAILPGATFEDAYAWLEAAKQEPFKANSFNIEFENPKIDSLIVTNRQGEMYNVRMLFISYKQGLKPIAVQKR